MERFPETFPTTAGDVRILRAIGKGKSGYSFLGELDGRSVVLKRMHQEPCPYYSFNDDKVILETRAYAVLRGLGIPVPELLAFDVERQYLVKAYVEGDCASRWLPAAPDLEQAVKRLFGISATLRRQGLNIDYFPANFVVNRGGLHYVDYEVNPYSTEWSFENWGIYYWANRRGMAEYAATGEWRCINAEPASGIPIKAPFAEQVKIWCDRYRGDGGLEAVAPQQ